MIVYTNKHTFNCSNEIHF